MIEKLTNTVLYLKFNQKKVGSEKVFFAKYASLGQYLT